MFRSASVTIWAATFLLCCAGARAGGANAKEDPIIIIAGGGDAHRGSQKAAIRVYEPGP
jgi:hypothetical protein